MNEKNLEDYITQHDPRFSITDWSNHVRDDQSLDWKTHHTLLTLKQRYPNIFPGISKFMQDGKLKQKQTAVDRLELARQSPYAYRSKHGGHGHGNDEYALCYPVSVENPHSSLGMEKPHPMSVEKPHSVECGKTTPQEGIEEEIKDYKPTSPSGSAGSQNLHGVDLAASAASQPAVARSLSVEKPHSRESAAWWRFGGEYVKKVRKPAGNDWQKVSNPKMLADLSTIPVANVWASTDGFRWKDADDKWVGRKFAA